MPRRSEFTTIAAVAAGGVIGAAARWAVGMQLAGHAVAFPWHTFAVNVAGCLLIGFAAARVRRDTTAWAFTATGLLGGFTTMSSFAVELNDFVDDGRSALAVVYLLATVAVGVGSLLLAESVTAATPPPDPDTIE